MVRLISMSSIFCSINFCVPLLLLNTFLYDLCLYKYNSCEFDIQKLKSEIRYGVSILKYQSADDLNSNKLQLSEYFLIKSGNDTINVIATYLDSRSDSTIRRHRNSANWVFLPRKDSACFEFCSNFNLKKAIENKYPVQFGQIVIGND